MTQKRHIDSGATLGAGDGLKRFGETLNRGLPKSAAM
jgi:hypothetical protein